MSDDSAWVKKTASKKERQRSPSKPRVCFVGRVLPWDFLSKKKANKTKKNKLQSEAGKQTHKRAHRFQSKVAEAKDIGIIENRLDAALGEGEYEGWTNLDGLRDLYSFPEWLYSFLLISH